MGIPVGGDPLMSVDMETGDEARRMDPFCFRCGEIGVKLEYDNNAPPLQEVLTRFMLRKQSGI